MARYRRYRKRLKKKMYKSSVKSIVRKELAKKIEYKKFPVYLTTTVDNVGAVTKLTNISQSDDQQGRIGNKIYLSSLKLLMGGIAADTTNYLRVIIFQWIPDDTTDAPTVAKILQDTTNVIWYSPYIFNSGARMKFKVLYDKVLTLSTSTNSTTKKVNIYKGFKKNIGYSTDAVTTGSNQLYLLRVSDSGTASHPSFQFHGQVTFSDL